MTAPPTVVTSRFNCITLTENRAFVAAERERGCDVACVYSSPTPISSSVARSAVIFVLEMNNDINRVEAVGMLRNVPAYDAFAVYASNTRYNAFSYRGKHRVARTEMNKHEEKIMRALDVMCFTGSRHQKRLSGLKVFPARILRRCRADLDVAAELGAMFKTRM